ncbi:MAG: type II toxin-antitoxin system RelE/ParE family toxin [Anaerolineaceae bacterium]|nr:type II toxin-antitoxin system RelE/ParE family toxin [Anaerolineaceae bacterium]
MAYSVAFTKQAAKTMQKIPASMAMSIRLKIEQIAENPFDSHPNVTKLQNREGYRLRVGDWRIIYEIQQNKVLVLVLKIGLRGEVYR